MITPEEERQIIDKAKEEILLTLPTVWSSLFTEMKAQGELYEQFFKDHTEFKDHKDAVKTVFGDITGKYPNMDHADQIKKALPEIRKRIGETKDISMEINPSPNTDFKPMEANLDIDHGEI